MTPGQRVIRHIDNCEVWLWVCAAWNYRLRGIPREDLQWFLKQRC